MRALEFFKIIIGRLELIVISMIMIRGCLRQQRV